MGSVSALSFNCFNVSLSGCFIVTPIHLLNDLTDLRDDPSPEVGGAGFSFVLNRSKTGLVPTLLPV